jgi:hypothetical protein
MRHLIYEQRSVWKNVSGYDSHLEPGAMNWISYCVHGATLLVCDAIGSRPMFMLCHPKGAVEPISFLKKLSVGPTLDHLAFVQHQDFIDIDHCR